MKQSSQEVPLNPSKILQNRRATCFSRKLETLKRLKFDQTQNHLSIYKPAINHF